jgi:serine/threonine-protein kinase HipA
MRGLLVFLDEPPSRGPAGSAFVGRLEQDGSGSLSFHYDSSWLSRTDARPISLSLPLRAEPYADHAARAFFSGLLPDADARARLAKYLGVSEANPFALLREVGWECAGAIALRSERDTTEDDPGGDADATAPGRIAADRSDQASRIGTSGLDVLDEARLAGSLRDLPSRPLLLDRELRLSLAGAQDKIAVCRIDGAIALALDHRPTTHLLKPPIQRFPDSAHNEHFCMRLADRMGLAVAAVELGSALGAPYLLVERYDRVTDASGATRRIHQEDFCQALGVPPELKYQNEGGPSLPQCFELLARHGARAAADRIALLDAVIFNALIGNADAHAKNFSLIHEARGVVLAKLYDLTSTAVYPDLSPRMAMKIGSKYVFDDLLARHWEGFARECGLAPPVVRRRIQAAAAEIPEAARELAKEFVGGQADAPVLLRILDTIERRAARARSLW